MKTDFHCHILPGIDDGAQTLEEAVFLAGKLVQFGYERAICTSHSSYKFRNTPTSVNTACALLREELQKQNVPLELVPSMEYRIIPETWPEVREKGWLMPWDDNHLLIELPISKPEKIGDLVALDEMRKLIEEGYRPVLAHPERYWYFSPEDYLRFKELGVEFQRNLGSLEGLYGAEAQHRACQLQDQGLYERLGTDTHSKRYTDFFEKYVFGPERA